MKSKYCEPKMWMRKSITYYLFNVICHCIQLGYEKGELKTVCCLVPEKYQIYLVQTANFNL